MFNLLKLFWRNFFSSLIEIIFPEFCIGCKKLNTLLCNKCYEKLEFIQFKINTKNKTPYLDSIICCCSYEDLAKKIVYELKYKSVINAGKIIAHIMYYNSNFNDCDLITFVPMHKKKIGKRGFNQSKVIANELSKLLNKPIAELLIKNKNTKSQMSLGLKSDRQFNVEGSIEMNPKVLKEVVSNNFSVLIVDDVFTSGTTLNYCAKTLKEFGFSRVHTACFLHKT